MYPRQNTLFVTSLLTVLWCTHPQDILVKYPQCMYVSYLYTGYLEAWDGRVRDYYVLRLKFYKSLNLYGWSLVSAHSLDHVRLKSNRQILLLALTVCVCVCVCVCF